ncbi:ComF family protein [bacterium]|nr:ComF family protein [bacterium]
MNPIRPRPLAAIRGWGAAVLDFVYPPLCMICRNRLSAAEHTVCDACRTRLDLRPQWRCQICGGAGIGGEPRPGRPCRLCPPAGAAWRGVFSVVGYGTLPARCVHMFKYQRRIELGRVMARLICERLAGPIGALAGRIDVIAPVPLHWARRMGRGFNQSTLLARPLASALGLPMNPRLLRRVRYTRRQALLPREQRGDNIRGAFGLGSRAGLDGLGVLLIDDVVTSGATIDECARTLMSAGAREVWAASYARAGMGGPEPEE